MKLDFVKFEIYCYPLTKKLLNNFLPYTTHTSVALHQMQVVEAIETALNLTRNESVNGEHKLKLIFAYFWSNTNPNLERLAMDYHVHVNTAQLWIKKFVKKVGEILGLFD